MDGIVLKVDGDVSKLEGNTFQIHILPDNKIRLYQVIIPIDLARCPAIIHGERCGGKVGHLGKHSWSNGD